MSNTPSLDSDYRESTESYKHYRDSEFIEDEEDIEDHLEREAAVDAFLLDAHQQDPEQPKQERSSAESAESGRILDELEVRTGYFCPTTPIQLTLLQ
jgi:hypothetical protein